MEFLSRAGGCTCPCGSRGQHHHRRSQAGHSHPGLAQSSSALCAPNIMGEYRTSCKDRRGAGLRDGCCSMVLSAEDVKRAQMNFGTERCDGLDKHTCLNGHVQRAIDVHALDWLLRPELCAAVHLRFNVLNLDAWEAFRPSMPILLSKCQMLPTMALLFIFFMRSRVMILDLTAQETKMPTSSTTCRGASSQDLVASGLQICQEGYLRLAGADTPFDSECRHTTRLFTQPKSSACVVF